MLEKILRTNTMQWNARTVLRKKKRIKAFLNSVILWISDGKLYLTSLMVFASL